MASCSLGVVNLKVSAIRFNKARLGNLLKLNDQRLWLAQKAVTYGGLMASRQSVKAVEASFLPSPEAEDLAKEPEEAKPSALTSPLIPKSSEVETLVNEICNTTSIAEFELKLAGFRLYIARDVAEKSVPSPPPAPAPVSVNAVTEDPPSTGSVSSPSLAITRHASSSGGTETLVDKAADEGLVILQSPKVGFFRRSRMIKGKHMPPSCQEKQTVKEGQVLCYIEQLGGQIPIESDVSGEVVKIFRQDGDPVGYNDALIAILPSFPGIKKLQ